MRVYYPVLCQKTALPNNVSLQWYNFDEMKLSYIDLLVQIIRKTVSLFNSHKILVVASMVLTIIFVLFGSWVIRVKNDFLHSLASASKDHSNEIRIAPPTSSPSADTGILGASDDSTSADIEETPLPKFTPFPTFPPIPSLAPIPTPTPTPITYPSSAPTTCAGKPIEDNSQVYVSPSTTAVGNSATISVELRDCNNNFAPVNDTLTVTLSSGDSEMKINGASSPVTVQAQNGKATFTITSQNATTGTFVIFNSTRPFTVTTPGYHNPAVTFTSSASGGSGNTNCTTSVGAPNAYYSDIYPNPPVTTSTGSVTLQAVIRDCFKNTTSVSDSLIISLISGDAGTKVNGNSLPYTISAQNGQASFTVASQVNGTVTLKVQDATSSFTITDPNNHNPSITFSGSSNANPTDTPTPTPAVSGSATPTPTQGTQATPTLTPTPTSFVSLTPSPTP